MHSLYLWIMLLPAVVAQDCMDAEYHAEQVMLQQENVSLLTDYLLKDSGRHEAFSKLAQLSDMFGPRLSGGQVLEQAIDYIVAQMEQEGLENVATENVTVPQWTRGSEYARLLSPRQVNLPMLGLGTSVGTNGSEITADVIVVTSFDELDEKADEVQGKIVVYNQPWKGYSNTVQYRSSGASRAARHGAVAALIRSMTNFSIATPHTGVQTYDDNVTQIPAACITVEDAEMLHRMYNRGDNITVFLYMEAQNFPDTVSRNVIGEIVGYEYPEQLVIFGGHIDSWDVGTGSMDDGGGVIISLQAIYALKRLNLRPRRTLRVVLWTGEEFGLYGGEEYYERHQELVDNISLIMESDFTTLIPYGIGFTGSGFAKFILERVVRLLGALGVDKVVDGGSSSDIGGWVNAGVPAANLYAKSDTYFDFHHTQGDTMTVLDADGLDRSTVLWATVAYVVGNLVYKLPRTGEYPVDCDISHGTSINNNMLLLIVVSFVICKACH